MKAAIYGRVSTDEQTRVQSIETQLYTCRQYASEDEVVAEYLDEGVSGTVPLRDRPAGKRLLADAEAKRFELVIVYRLDRLGRDTLEALLALKRLEDLKVKVESTSESFDDSPMGRWMQQQLLGMAQFERAIIKQRTMDGRQRRVREGKYQAPVTPYGYIYDVETGTLKEHPVQADVVRQIFAWALAGLGSKQIADKLDDSGVEAPHGNRRRITTLGWNWGTIAKMLKAPRYIGRNTYGDQPMPCRALVDEPTFALVQEGLTARKYNATRNTKAQYLLQHLIYCRRCGSRYTCMTRKGGQQWYACHQRRTYGVKGGHADIRWHFRATELDEIVKNQLGWLMADPERFFSDVDADIEQARHQLGTVNDRMRQLEKSLAEFPVQEDRVLAMARRGLIDEARVDRQILAIEKERREVEAELATAKNEEISLSAQERLEFLERIRDMKGQRLPVLVREGDRLLRPQIEPDPITKRPTYVFVDNREPESDADFDTWHTWVHQLISHIWVETDGSLTIEGPGQIQITNVTVSMPTR